MLNLDLITEVSESNIIKLASVVGDEHKQNSKPDNNILLDELPHLGLDYHSQWLDFYPHGEVVHGNDVESSLCYYYGVVPKVTQKEGELDFT